MKKSAVQEAMLILGGRPEHLAAICNVSAQSAWNWVSRGRVYDAQHAVAIAEACVTRGHPEITVARLAGMEDGTPVTSARASSASRQAICTDPQERA